MQNLMTKCLKIVERSHFWVIFDHFLVIFAQTRFFYKNSKNNSTGSPNPMLNITKNWCVNSNNTYTFEKKEQQTEGWRKDGQKDGWKDGLKDRQTLLWWIEGQKDGRKNRRTDRRTEEQTEGKTGRQTLFYRTLSTTAGDPMINIVIIVQI